MVFVSISKRKAWWFQGSEWVFQQVKTKQISYSDRFVELLDQGNALVLAYLEIKKVSHEVLQGPQIPYIYANLTSSIVFYNPRR